MVCPGDTIRILEMDGHPEYKYKLGVVQHVDDDGQMFGTWGSLGVVPDRDRYLVVGNDGEKRLNRVLILAGVLVALFLVGGCFVYSDMSLGWKVFGGWLIGVAGGIIVGTCTEVYRG